MIRKVMVIVAGIILLSVSNSWAEPCAADITCDNKVDLSDLVTMKSEFLNTGCDPCMCNPIYACPSGMTDCDGSCIDPLTDREHCGADSNCIGGSVCGAGEICDSGVCILTCQPGLTDCNGLCVDTQSNENHCGGCDILCESGEVCIAGNCEIYCSDNYAPVVKTGQTATYAIGDDGYYNKGIAWPNPRFTDNGDGTVTDNLTGLIWLKDADCFGQRTWAQAISDCNQLSAGYCGLSDGSSIGDWRLPNLFELESLRDMKYYIPVLSNTTGTSQWTEGDSFTNLQHSAYWSSTTNAGNAGGAWYVDLYDGNVNGLNKTYIAFVLPVRGGQ